MTDSDVSSAVEAPVLFEERRVDNGKRIGIATLNAPEALNGLSLVMAQLLDAQLLRWAEDAAVVLVVLQGAGEKAFCAGGDLQALYRSMRDFRASGSSNMCDNAYALNFFVTEYRLDYRIHTYPKPLLCWGHGLVMGGGIGLMAGASHRVVTERSKLAFPEIAVGLYPDVGGSWLLNRVPDRAGLFLALTGAPLDASDAIHAGLADFFIAQNRRGDVFAALLKSDWTDVADHNRERLDRLLHAFTDSSVPGPLQRHAEIIATICANDDLDAVAAAIESIDGNDPWLNSARQTFAAGSPGSARLGFELQQRALSLSLSDTFRMECVASLHCAAHGDFTEGIRALLIDKDRDPHWDPATLDAANASWVETFFIAPWPAAQHPLADLGHADSINAWSTYA